MKTDEKAKRYIEAVRIELELAGVEPTQPLIAEVIDDLNRGHGIRDLPRVIERVLRGRTLRRAYDLIRLRGADA